MFFTVVIPIDTYKKLSATDQRECYLFRPFCFDAKIEVYMTDSVLRAVINDNNIPFVNYLLVNSISHSKGENNETIYTLRYFRNYKDFLVEQKIKCRYLTTKDMTVEDTAELMIKRFTQFKCKEMKPLFVVLKHYSESKSIFSDLEKEISLYLNKLN